MTVPINDIKHSLRKREFPYSARYALTHAEELLGCNGNMSRVQMMKQTELAMELISEFVFNEVDRKGYRKKLTSGQELELLQVMSDHMMFDGGGNEASRNAIFLLLFPPNITERVRLLVLLVSLAASTKNVAVLNAAGLLIQQVGYSSPYSILFVQGMVKDHIMLLEKTSPSLTDLPKMAPLFSANFLTASTYAYSYSESKQIFTAPPEHVLEVVTDWISQNPTLCLSPLMPHCQPALPHGSIPMIPTTPYSGLIKWCVFSQLDRNASSLYSTLEGNLLLSLMESTVLNARALMGKEPNLMSVNELSSLVPILLSSTNSSQHGLQMAVDALAQAVLAGVDSDALSGPKQDLWGQLRRLPQTELLRIILGNLTLSNVNLVN